MDGVAVDDARRRMAAWWFGAPSGRETILVIGHELTRTGAPLALHGLVERLAREPEVELRMLALTGGPLGAAANVPLLVWDALPCDGTEAWQLLGDMATARRPDLVICNTVLTSPLAGLFAARGVPVLALVYELSTSIELFFGHVTIDRMMAAASAVVLPSHFAARELAERFALDRRKLTVIPTGCRIAERPPVDRGSARRAVAERFNLDPDAPLVVGCGTLSMRKGCDLFVQLAQQLGGAASHAQFMWIGEGDPAVLNWCQHDVGRLGMAGRVHFVGPVDEPADALVAADVFVLPSREDPFPLVVVEALRCGVPVVAFDGAGGAPEAIGDAGRVVPYLDVAAMAAAVDAILGDPARRAALAAQARTAAQRFDFDDYYRRVRGLTREICAGRRL